MNRRVAGMIAGLSADLLSAGVLVLTVPLITPAMVVGVAGAVGTTFTTSAVAAPLAPEHEVRRLTMAARQAIQDSRWDEASQHLTRLQHLKAEKPPEYHFYRGRVMLHGNQLNEARSALETYVAEAGKKGEHYDQALQFITQIESRRDVRAAANQGQAPVATIEPAQRIDVEALQRLYLEDKPSDALAAHVNSLLSTNAWQPGPVFREKPEETLEYRITTESNGSLQIRETQRRPGQGPTVRTRTFPVFGINPIISYDCYESDGSCWLFDPRDESRWLRLANRPAAAEEVSQVLGELMRQLQKGGS